MTNSLSFPFSENVLISPPFLKDIFIGYRILGWQLFSFGTWKMFYFFLNSMVSDEKSTVSCIVFALWVIDCFSLTDFKIFSLYLVFRSLLMACLGVNFFGFIPSGFAHLLESVGVCLWPNLGSFHPLFLLSFWGSDDINLRSFVIVPQVSDALLIFFSLFSLCCSDRIISVVLSPSSRILSSVILLLLLSLASEWEFVIVFLSSIVYVGFFLYLLLLRLKFSI